jgi:hypothetical protein
MLQHASREFERNEGEFGLLGCSLFVVLIWGPCEASLWCRLENQTRYLHELDQPSLSDQANIHALRDTLNRVNSHRIWHTEQLLIFADTWGSAISQTYIWYQSNPITFICTKIIFSRFQKEIASTVVLRACLIHIASYYLELKISLN